LNSSLQIQLPDGYNREHIETLLVDNYPFKVEEPVSEKWVFYDTFDWLLFNKSLTLHQSGQGLLLRNLPDGEVLHRLIYTAAPRFAWDLPDSPLKVHLQPIIEPRALLKLAELSVQSCTYRVLDANGKTVARIIYSDAHITLDSSLAARTAYLSLQPVRGYPKYARGLTELLEQAGFAFSNWEDLYLHTLEAVGQNPGSYSSKIDVQLEPGMRSDDATKIILRRLLQVMRANQAGIRADTDTEFLHDYRVAIRRTRSALSQVRDVFPANTTTRFKEDFAYLGKFTNELRDLDVYLLSEDKYRDMLPDVLRDDISPLFEYLRGQREIVLKGVSDHLDSERYAQILSDWEVFLNEPVSEIPEAVNATMPIIDLAQWRIYKRYRRIIKDGNFLLDHPQAELMHALRIDCKKLRYLIEFFASLFPPNKIRQLINQLKRLQDNLGDFNDLSVQQEYLLTIAGELPINDMESRRALLATGSLVESLAHQQQLVRDAFAKTFTNFASPENQELYQQLYSGKERGAIS
jgi:CHAD domain-containing protein